MAMFQPFFSLSSGHQHPHPRAFWASLKQRRMRRIRQFKAILWQVAF